MMKAQTDFEIFVNKGGRTSSGIQCTFLQRKSLYLSTKLCTHENKYQQ